jgi:signal transduction histidine kinase
MLFKKKSQLDFFLHELKTPVSSILGAAEALKDFESLSMEQRKRFINIIEQKSLRLKVMLENCLVPAEKTLKPVLLHDLIEQTQNQWSDQIEAKKLKIKIDVPPQIKVWAYPKKLAMVFSNLLDNAIKYSPAQGLITLKGILAKKTIQMSLTDEGPGIDPKEQKKIFNPYYRSAQTKGIPGHGLGLAIVKEILKAHRSQIKVISQLGHGTTFKFDLPLVNA